jgi:hypothetical protein
MRPSAAPPAMTSDRDAQPGQRSSELDLAGQARVRFAMREVGQQFALVGHRRGHLRRPLRIHIDMARPTGTHAPADRRDTVFQVAQRLHDLQAGLRLNLMFHSVSINYSQQRHESLREIT